MLKKGGEDVEDSAIDEGSGDPNDQHSSSQSMYIIALLNLRTSY